MKAIEIIDLLTDASNAVGESIDVVMEHRGDGALEPSEMLLMSHTMGVWNKLAQQLSPELVEFGEESADCDIGDAYAYKYRNEDDTCDWDAMRRVAHDIHAFSYALWKQSQLFND